MTDPDSRAVRGTLRNWPTQPISGVGVPDIADNRLDQHGDLDCTTTAYHWITVVGVKGLTVNGSSQQPSAKPAHPVPIPPGVPSP